MISHTYIFMSHTDKMATWWVIRWVFDKTVKDIPNMNIVLGSRHKKLTKTLSPLCLTQQASHIPRVKHVPVSHLEGETSKQTFIRPNLGWDMAAMRQKCFIWRKYLYFRSNINKQPKPIDQNIHKGVVSLILRFPLCYTRALILTGKFAYNLRNRYTHLHFPSGDQNWMDNHEIISQNEIKKKCH